MHRSPRSLRTAVSFSLLLLGMPLLSAPPLLAAEPVYEESAEAELDESLVMEALYTRDVAALSSLVPPAQWNTWRGEYGDSLLSLMFDDWPETEDLAFWIAQGMAPMQQGIYRDTVTPDADYLPVFMDALLSNGSVAQRNRALGVALISGDAALITPLLNLRQANDVTGMQIGDIADELYWEYDNAEEALTQLPSDTANRLKDDLWFALFSYYWGETEQLDAWLASASDAEREQQQSALFHTLTHAARTDDDTTQQQLHTLLRQTDALSGEERFNGFSALLDNGHYQSAHWLLENHMDVSETEHGSAIEAVWWLVDEDSPEALIALWEYVTTEGDLNTRIDDEHLLRIALEQTNDTDLVERIIRQLKANDHFRLPLDEGAGLPALLLSNGFTDDATLLIKNSPNMTAEESAETLNWAYQNNAFDLVDSLLANGAKAGNDTFDGLTLYHRALQEGNVEQMQHWLSLSNDINSLNRDGQNLLHYALQQEQYDTAQWLITQNPSWNQTDRHGASAFTVAIQQAPLPWLTRNITALNDAQKTQPLLQIVLQGPDASDARIAALLSLGANVHAQDENGLDAADAAILNGNAAALTRLVQAYSPSNVSQTPTQGDKTNANPFNDPRVRYWSLLAWSGQHDTLLTHLKQDTQSDNAHPFGVYFWVKSLPKSQLESTLASLTDDDITRLGPALRARLLLLEDDNASALNAFPPHQAAQLNLFSLLDLYYAAQEEKNHALQFAYWEHIAQRAPDFFQTAWMLPNELVNAPQYQQKIDQLIAQHALQNTLLNQWWQIRRIQPHWENTDTLALLQPWLNAQPNDPRAHYAQAQALYNNGYRERAVYGAVKAAVLLPFWSNRYSPSQYLLYQNRITEAESYLSMVSQFDKHPNPERGANRVRYSTYADAGQYGIAIDGLAAHLDTWPNDLKAVSNYAEALNSVERRGDAITALLDAIKAQDGVSLSREQQGQLADLQRQLIRYYVSNDNHQQAIDLSIASGVSLSHQEVLNLLDAHKETRSADYAQQLSQAEQRYPDSHSIKEHRIRWHLERSEKTQAAQLVQTLHDSRQLYLTLAKEWLNQLNDADAQRTLQQWLADAPRSIVYWQVRASRDGDEATYRAAMAQHPHWYWPVEKLEQHYLNADKEPEALALVSDFRAKEDLNALPASTRLEVINDIVWATAMVGEYKPGELSRDDFQNAIALSDTLLQAHHSHYQYHHSRLRLFRLLGDDERTASAAHALGKHYPSNGDVAWFVLREGGDTPKALAYHYDFYQRNPYSDYRTKKYLQALLYYTGRPVLALAVIDRADRLGVTYPQHWRDKAYNDLGDSLSGFLAYKPDHYIADSERYIGWFESNRKEALHAEQMAVHYRLDGEHPSVRIIHPNGEVVNLTVDRVYGHVLRAQKGGMEAHLGWSEQGQLEQYRVGDEVRLTLDYDSQGNIQSAFMPGNQLHFRYDLVHNKTDWITLEGTGHMRVHYDDDGEIDRVFSPQGHQVSMAVSEFFSNLQSTVRRIGQLQSVDQLFAMNVDDPELEALQDAWDNTPADSPEETAADLALGRYLAKHAGQSPDYVARAVESLQRVFTRSAEDDSKQARRMAFESVELLHQLYVTHRPDGLPEEEYAEWLAMRQWLSNSGKAGRKLSKQVDAQPVSQLFEQSPLQSTTLANSGFWYRFGRQDMFGQLQNTRIHALAANNPYLAYAGTNHGLFVYQYGHWRQYHYAADTQRMRLADDYSANNSHNTVRAVALTDDAQLLIGSAGGFYVMQQDQQVLWPNRENGQPLNAAIDFITPDQNTGQSTGQYLIGSAEGLFAFDTTRGELRLINAELDRIDAATALPEDAGGGIVVSSAGELHWLQEDNTHALGMGTHPLWHAESARLLWLDSQGLQSFSANHLLRAAQNGKTRDLSPYLLADKQHIPHSKQIHGLTQVALHDEAHDAQHQQPAILTDQGLAVFLGNRIQPFTLPYEERRGGLSAGVLHASLQHNNLWLATTDGLYAFLPQRVTQLEYEDLPGQSRVHALVTHPQSGITYAATGDTILAFYPDAPTESTTFARTRSRILRIDSAGDLITHDGHTLVKYPQGQEYSVELFDADVASVDNGSSYWQGPIRDILPASDGTLWVAAGSSVFRWKDGEKQEFNYLVDRDAFPSRSPMISRIFETRDGTIYVAASDEGHIRHNGVSLRGGLLRWTGEKFENEGSRFDGRLPLAYTEISDNEAIIATTGAYYRESAGRWSNLRYNDTPSYNALDDVAPMLFMGSQGAQFGDSNTWLFPSAGGVLIQHNNGWFYPDRLNQLLPKDTTLGQYGARTVHAVSVNPDGVVYAGTDLGLLIYPAMSLAGLMSDHHQSGNLFSASQVVAEQQVRDVILSSLGNDNEAGELVTRIETLEAEILALRESRNDDDTSKPQTDARESDVNLTAQQRQRLKTREKERSRLLAQLEQEHRGLFKTLKLDPREAAALHERFAAGQVLVQYLPAGDQLAIQVVSRDGARAHLVNVNSEEISQAAARATRLLKASVHSLSRGFSAADSGHKNTPDDVAHAEQQQQLQQDLAFLYDVLLRPIERDLIGTRHLFIAPTGPLASLPFAALLRRSGSGDQYAAERYQLGVVHSLFHLNLVLDETRSESQQALFIADPDGSLPGARQEVADITPLFPDTNHVLRGNEAQLQQLALLSDNARYVHFATHGKLNPEAPADSYLLMANNTRLTVPDINLLDMQETDIVVLSACETGIGASGLEYATLARAFAHAGVPTVIASYWEVSDNATRALMVRLYHHLVRDGADSFTALANAQRDVIRLYPEFAHPAAWAGFTPFGRP